MFERARSPVGRDVGTVKGVIAPFAADHGMLAPHVPGIDARGALEERRAVILPNTMGAERDLRTRVACAESIQSPSCKCARKSCFLHGRYTPRNLAQLMLQLSPLLLHGSASSRKKDFRTVAPRANGNVGEVVMEFDPKMSKCSSFPSG